MSNRTPSLLELTPAQRRRAEALSLVHFLFPALDAATTHRIARWLVTGKDDSTSTPKGASR